MNLANCKTRIEEKLASLIPVESPYFPSLYEGGKYALLAPGKRMRPLLTVCTAEMLRKDALEAALVPACALEMVHTYSLIHDDLPCMDDDDFRRGLPTLHKVYTEGHAVLVGDYLLTHAFEVISSAPLLNAEQKVSLVQTLSHASGGEGMIGGQIMDIENSPHVEQMHARKTAALFCAAILFGGIIAECSKDTMQLLKTFGTQFGQLFQMVDDILDEDHPLGMTKAQESADHLYEKAIETLESLPYNSNSLKQLTETVWKQKSTLLASSV